MINTQQLYQWSVVINPSNPSGVLKITTNYPMPLSPDGGYVVAAEIIPDVQKEISKRLAVAGCGAGDDPCTCAMEWGHNTLRAPRSNFRNLDIYLASLEYRLTRWENRIDGLAFRLSSPECQKEILRDRK